MTSEKDIITGTRKLGMTGNVDKNGKYRVTSKRINFTTNSVTCNLQLNKKPIMVSDYILSQ